MDTSAPDEFALIARLTRGLRGREDVVLGVGDDCAILDLHSDTLLLATSDSQVEGVHFTLQSAQPEQIGHKALAVNLSDIAAMGGEPQYALVSLVIPKTYSSHLIEQIYDGLRLQAEAYHTAIVGGNIASTSLEQLIIDITLLGTVEYGHVLTRGGAQVGDLICVTGSLGDAAGGLYTFLHSDIDLPASVVGHVRRAHLLPTARVREGRMLSQLGPSIVTAMIDISDGLSGDLRHLCERSRVSAQIDIDRLPLSVPLQTLAARVSYDPVLWALHGGEDYELLFTVSPAYEQLVRDTIVNATGTQVSTIGTIKAGGREMFARYPDGRVETLQVKSWNHL